MHFLRQLWQFLLQIGNRVRQDEHFGQRLLAVLLAIVLWLAAGGATRFAPSEESFTVPIVVQNIPENLFLASQPESVHVRVRAFAPFMPRDGQQLTARVDLSQAIAGEGTYSVDIETPPRVELISASPRWVRVLLEPLVEAEVPVTLAVFGLHPDEAVVGARPQPSVVTVRGPQAALDRVVQVVAYVTIEPTQVRAEGEFPVRAVDEVGRVIEQIIVEPDIVFVQMERIQQGLQPAPEVMD